METNTEIKIYYRDTDCGGVVYYANYLEYLEIARTEFLSKQGVEVKDLAERGFIFTVKKTEIEYASPAKYGETLLIKTKMDAMTAVTINFSYEITEKNSGRLVSKAKTLLVCVSPEMKPKRIPPEVRKIKI